MTLINALEIYAEISDTPLECFEISVVENGKEVARYDGRDSIPACFNDREIEYLMTPFDNALLVSLKV